MMRCVPLLLILLPLVACTAVSSRQAPEAPVIALTRVTLVDVEAGRLQPEMTVIIRGERVHDVGRTGAVEVPRDARVIDAAGKYLIPGLWDMHVHLSDAGKPALPLFVAHGVTGVRDMGAPSFERLEEWREESAQGDLVGPHIVAAGPILDNPPPEWPLGLRVRIASAEEAGRAVDSLAAVGVDFIKVHVNLPREAYFAVAEQARERGLPFAGHKPAGVTLIEAAEAGQRSIEHVMEFALPQDSLLLRRTYDALRQEETWITPTLLVSERVARLDDPELLRDERRRYVSPELAAFWEEQKLAWPDDLEPAMLEAAFASAMSRVERLNEAGVPLLVGTDLGVVHVYPGSSIHEELRLLVRAGLTPAEALRAATVNAARFLGAADSLGTIEPGKLADLVLLDADPLEEIANTEEIFAVLRGGRYLDRAALDDLLVEAVVAPVP